MTIPISSGGGIPVRGVQQFSITTDDDYSFNGQRFLRMGVVETDQNEFDISIWDVKDYVPDTVEGDKGASVNIVDIYVSDSGLYMLYEQGGNIKTSTDNGLTWQTKQTGLTSSATNFIELNTVPVTYMIQSSSSPYSMYVTTDDWDTFNTVSIGGSTPYNLATDGSHIISSGASNRYSDDGGATWNAVSGLLQNGESQLAYGNGYWVGIDGRTNSTNGSDIFASTDGISFTNVGNVFTGNTSGQGYNCWYDADDGKFKFLGEVSANQFRHNSYDAVNDIIAGVQTASFPASVLDKVRASTNGDVVATQGVSISVSKDKGVTWTAFFKPSQGSGNAATAVLQDGEGFVSANSQYVLNVPYVYYAGIYDILDATGDRETDINEMTFVRIS